MELITTQQTAEALGVSADRLDSLVEAGLFPKATEVGPQGRKWRRGDLPAPAPKPKTRERKDPPNLQRRPKE